MEGVWGGRSLFEDDVNEGEEWWIVWKRGVHAKRLSHRLEHRHTVEF